MSAPEREVPIGSRAREVLSDRRLLVILLAACCMLAVAVTAFGFSGTLSTASSTSPNNLITSGTLRMSLSENGQIVDGTGFAPGVARHGDVTVTLLNGRADLRLTVTSLSGDTGLADILAVDVSETAPGSEDELYDEPLSDLQDINLGRFSAPDQGPSDIPQQRTYEIQVWWPPDADDASNQGKTISFNFRWRMVSS